MIKKIKIKTSHFHEIGFYVHVISEGKKQQSYFPSNLVFAVNQTYFIVSSHT